MRHSPMYHGAYKENKKYKQSNKIKTASLKKLLECYNRGDSSALVTVFSYQIW